MAVDLKGRSFLTLKDFTAEEIEAYTVTKQKDYDDEVKAIIDLADELQVPVVVAGGVL